MPEHKYAAPAIDKDVFTCAHCGTYAQQAECKLTRSRGAKPTEVVGTMRVCCACDGLHIWYTLGCENEPLYLYPLRSSAPPLSPDAPPKVQEYYEEAATIAQLSPRGAAALLRLAVQVLLSEILQKEVINLNEAIREIVSNGLPPKLQKAFDIVRITGNDAVHPGQIDTDSPETVRMLFGLVNLIIEKMITEPREIDTWYDNIPAAKREAIDKRDTNPNGS